MADYFSRLAQQAQGQAHGVTPALAPLYAPSPQTPEAVDLAGFEAADDIEASPTVGPASAPLAPPAPGSERLQPSSVSPPASDNAIIYPDPPPIARHALVAPGWSERPLAETRKPQAPAAFSGLDSEPHTPGSIAPALGWPSLPRWREGAEARATESARAEIEGGSRADAQTGALGDSRPDAGTPEQATIRAHVRVAPETISVKRAVEAPERAAAPREPWHLESTSDTADLWERASPAGALSPTIHVTIGRIEVRAITPPPALRPAAPPSSSAFDDYRRQRRERRT
jgi:hypothetical protein